MIEAPLPETPGLDDQPEEVLVAAAMRVKRAAMTVLWDRHRRWIAAVLLAHKPRFEDLEDLLQEVAMTLVTKVGTLREETNLRAWLRMVAINAARAAGRSGKHRPRAVASEAILAAAADRFVEDDHADADERTRDLLRRIERLPETYREPLLLRAGKGLRSKQIADLLDIPPATVDTRIARARRMLREGDDDLARDVSTEARIDSALDGSADADADAVDDPVAPALIARRRANRAG